LATAKHSTVTQKRRLPAGPDKVVVVDMPLLHDNPLRFHPKTAKLPETPPENTADSGRCIAPGEHAMKIIKHKAAEKPKTRIPARGERTIGLSYVLGREPATRESAGFKRPRRSPEQLQADAEKDDGVSEGQFRFKGRCDC
jgi:hypothetical protein